MATAITTTSATYFFLLCLHACNTNSFRFHIRLSTPNDVPLLQDQEDGEDSCSLKADRKKVLAHQGSCLQKRGCGVLGCDGAVEDGGAAGGDGAGGPPRLALLLPHRRQRRRTPTQEQRSLRLRPTAFGMADGEEPTLRLQIDLQEGNQMRFSKVVLVFRRRLSLRVKTH
ncbi:uncharacterized protein [Triticum aestivum]|uniref:uncharacterized protein n=1 Tax=Triticum aestivum TaxID=4565 RepID=UPI001D0138CB|nr:uncharacterized protein LOC123048825 [Triticum aestivum]